MSLKSISRQKAVVLLSIAVLVAAGCNMPGIAPQAVQLFPTETIIPFEALTGELTMTLPVTGAVNETPAARQFVAATPGEVQQVPATGPSPTPPPTVTAPAGQPRCMAPAVSAAPDEVVVFVYFYCNNQLTSVPRVVPQGDRDALAYAAMQALLAGPTAAERAAGYTSWFSAQTAGSLRSLTASPDGQVAVDMKDFSAVIPNASSSTGSQLLVSQISATIFQFPDYQSILLSFEGDCSRFWNWLQSDCSQITRAP
jgi:hypothetical protein